MSTELVTAVPQRLLFAGCKPTTRALHILPDLAPEASREIYDVLRAISACSQWFWGDYLVWIEGHAFAQKAAELREQHNEASDEAEVAKRITVSEAYAKEKVYTTIRDMHNSETIAKAWLVAKQIAPYQRAYELSWDHYFEALSATQWDSEAALGWLQEAHDGAWSVSTLRKQIRLAQAVEPKQGTQAMHKSALLENVISVQRWVLKASPDEDAEVLDKLDEDLSTTQALVRKKISERTRELETV